MDEHQKKLIEYINGQLQKGADREIIMRGLADTGWPKDRIDEAFRSISSIPQPNFTETKPVSTGSGNAKKGLGGWMIPFIIILCLYIYRQFYLFYDRILFFLSYAKGTLPDGETEQVISYAISLGIVTLFLVLAIYTLYLIFNKKEKLPKFAIIFLGIVVLGNLISNALSFFIGVSLIGIIGSIAGGILIPFIAWRYIVSSKRVKATFVAGSKRNFWWIPLAFALAVGATAPYFILYFGLNNTLAQARDGQRVSDLSSIQRTLDSYYSSHQAYPSSLDMILNEPNPEIGRIPVDPSSGKNYEYNSDGKSYTLCANTETKGYGTVDFTNHKYCVEQEAGAKKLESVLTFEMQLFLTDYYEAHQRFPESLADLKGPPTHVDVTGIKNIQYRVLDNGKSYEFCTKTPDGNLCFGPDSFEGTIKP